MTNSDDYRTLKDSIEAAALARSGKAVSGEVLFLCVAHEERNPSARWNRDRGVWHCFACAAGGGMFDLAKRLGLEFPPPSTSLALSELAAYVGLSVEFLRSIGLTEGVSGVQRAKCVDIPYADATGEAVAVRKRLRLTGEPRMIWRRGDKAIPYGLARLGDARSGGSLLIVEGESDAWTAWHAGQPALGLPGAATWKSGWREHVEGIETVYVWREPDQGGDTLIARISADLPDVRIIQPPTGLKDLSSLWHATGHDRAAFLDRLRELLDAARPASQLTAESMSAEGRALLGKTRSLLDDPRLIDRIEAAISCRGYAGDATPPVMAYLALTSRLLDRPLNLAFVAPSGAGKNRAVDAALELMPPEAFHLEKAGSARALIYSEESFEHRAVIVAEADSIPQDEGSAASAIRSLAEDGFMTYDVVQTDPQTGNLVTRRIVKAGPTALITTSTRPLKEQLSTRVLTVAVNDTPEQTRNVLRAHARAVNGHRPNFDPALLVDLQRWYALTGDRDVTIPFSVGLAELVPNTHVRMRRDFRQFLTIVQAVALLHQRQRDRDDDGRIVATFDDYAMARRLALSAFTTAATDGVTPSVRATVAAVAELCPEEGDTCMRKEVAEIHGIAPRTAGDRLHRAMELDYVVNVNPLARQPGMYRLGEPLPENRPPLPTVEELEAHMCIDHAEIARHAATPSDPQVRPESTESVAESVAEMPATLPATIEEPSPDSESTVHGGAWRRGCGNEEVQHTRMHNTSPPSGEMLDHRCKTDAAYCPIYPGEICANCGEQAP